MGTLPPMISEMLMLNEYKQMSDENLVSKNEFCDKTTWSEERLKCLKPNYKNELKLC